MTGPFDDPPPAYTTWQSQANRAGFGPEPLEGITFIFLDSSTTLPPEWGRALRQHVPETIREQFTVVHGRLNQLSGVNSKFDCIVSPANSHGRLDGGFDYHLSRAISPSDPSLPTKLAQAQVYKQWKGYQPPGTCTLVPLENTPCSSNIHNCTYIALCPSMRVPSSIVWNREIVYNCMWSLLVTIDAHNQSIGNDTNNANGTNGGGGGKIKKVLMTGFGTGTGGISPQRCAQQMALAVRDYVDASTHKEKWSKMSMEEAIEIASDCRQTHHI